MEKTEKYFEERKKFTKYTYFCTDQELKLYNEKNVTFIALCTPFSIFQVSWQLILNNAPKNNTTTRIFVNFTITIITSLQLYNTSQTNNIVSSLLRERTFYSAIQYKK